jgi:hypothetical protein
MPASPPRPPVTHLPLLTLRSRAWRGVGCAGAVALAAQLLAGCYTYAPVDTSAGAPADRDVAVDLTDRGRYELGGTIGQSPRRIEGRILATSDSTLTLAVRSVQSITGATSTWAGESLQVRRTGVSGVSARRLSRSRTALFVLAVATGFALVVTAGLAIANNNGASGGDTGGPGGET